MTAIGTGGTKKVSKHNAARAMLDILEGRASAVTEEVSQSITDGLKALRGGEVKEEEQRTKTFKPQFVCKQSEQEYLASQKKHQEEIIKQSLEYGPLGVKLWFSGDSKIKEITSDTSTASSSGQTAPNRAPSEPFSTDDDRFENVSKGQFFIKGPVHNESIEDFIEKIVLDAAWMEILKRDGKAENVCKLCNLVFKSRKYYDEHKYTDDHLHVCKGYFPGKGGYHCFLCWISFNQPEGLLNHVSRANHQKRSEKKGVARIWMEPVSNKSWDLINVHKHLEDCRREDASKERRRRERSPDRWSHDKYEEEEGGGRARRKLSSDYYKWREVKSERSRDRSRDRSHRDTRHGEERRERRSQSREESSHRDRQKSREESSHKDRQKSRERSHREESREVSKSHHREPSSSSDLREILRAKRRDERSEVKVKRKSRERSESSRKKKRSRRDSSSSSSDHEEVNETHRVDVGHIENGEETLQKMKSAIIGILDEEIFALSQKK